jgi:hypothetical protein
METVMNDTEVPQPATDSARERHAIDQGRRDDKVAAPDPATAPLGTDDEAAQGHDEAGLKTAREQAARGAPPKISGRWYKGAR